MRIVDPVEQNLPCTLCEESGKERIGIDDWCECGMGLLICKECLLMMIDDMGIRVTAERCATCTERVRSSFLGTKEVIEVSLTQ